MIGLAFILAIWPFQHRPTIVDTRGEAKHWQYDLVQDRFTGATICRMTRGPLEVSRGLIRINLGKAVDTADALYRIDDQPARRWRETIPFLIAHGVSVQDDSLTNPSGGVVTLPLSVVIGARKVEIRPNGAREPRTYPIYALGIAVDRARAKGCTVDNLP